MVVEHEFVTTVPSEQAMKMASDLLSGGGFETEAEGAFVVGQAGWNVVQMRRGRKRAYRVKDPTEAPQQVRVEWDRGRVTVAGSIQVPARQNRRFYYGGVVGLAIAGSSSGKSTKQTKPYTDLMVSIELAVELLLTGQATPEEARAEWRDAEAALKEKARKARVRSWIILGIFLAVVVAFIVFVAVEANSHHGY